MKEAMRLRIGHYIVRAPHGDGRGGVFGNPPFVRHSSVRLVSGESHALRPVARAKRRLMRTESRAFTSGFPCNTTATHPAAPLGSGELRAKKGIKVGSRNAPVPIGIRFPDEHREELSQSESRKRVLPRDRGRAGTFAPTRGSFATRK